MDEQHALARLVESVKEANRWTNRELANRAERANHQVSGSNISRVLTSPVKTVVPNQIRMLADATGLPLSLVTAAAVRAAGLPLPDDERRDLVTEVQRDPDLPLAVKEAVMAIIQPYKKRRPASTPARATQADYDLAAGYPDASIDPVQRARMEQDRSDSQDTGDWEPA